MDRIEQLKLNRQILEGRKLVSLIEQMEQKIQGYIDDLEAGGKERPALSKLIKKSKSGKTTYPDREAIARFIQQTKLGDI